MRKKEKEGLEKGKEGGDMGGMGGRLWVRR